MPSASFASRQSLAVAVKTYGQFCTIRKHQWGAAVSRDMREESVFLLVHVLMYRLESRDEKQAPEKRPLEKALRKDIGRG